MIERILSVNDVDLTIFFGVNNSNLQLIKILFPKLRIGVRDNVIKLLGEKEEMDKFEKSLGQLQTHCLLYNSLTEDVIVGIVKGETPTIEKDDNLIIHGVNGRAIVARTKNQRLLTSLYKKNDMLFAVGPAGSGKTYTAIALAVAALKNKEVRKIILSRPAVEAGEKLGFLPGDMKEKIDPYLQPLYDALEDMIPAQRLKDYTDNKIIQIAPLAFMRGRTLGDAVIILDEAQNTTIPQLKMFLTRMGLNAKMIITGDMTQIDLPSHTQSGLGYAMRILKEIPGIGIVEFDKGDIVRHKLVQRIVEAYEQNEQREQTNSRPTLRSTPRSIIQTPIIRTEDSTL